MSVYHVLLERFPSLESGACDVANPCTIIWVRRLGYLTIPTMALSAFALIVALMLARAPVGPGARSLSKEFPMPTTKSRPSSPQRPGR